VAWARRGGVSLDEAAAALGRPQRRTFETFRRPERAEEYALSRWLLARLGAGRDAMRSISHCDTHVAVAVGHGVPVGIDIEDRLPRTLDAVGARLGWPEGADALQCWTLWEAWRKLDGGSVLDAPDAVYHAALRRGPAIARRVTRAAGVRWRTLALGEVRLSIAAPDA
jgi:hypothetical protein